MAALMTDFLFACVTCIVIAFLKGLSNKGYFTTPSAFTFVSDAAQRYQSCGHKKAQPKLSFLVFAEDKSASYYLR
jgi:hypothetical protein